MYIFILALEMKFIQPNIDICIYFFYLGLFLIKSRIIVDWGLTVIVLKLS